MTQLCTEASLGMLHTFGQSAHLAKRAAHLANLPNVRHLANCAAHTGSTRQTGDIPFQLLTSQVNSKIHKINIWFPVRQPYPRILPTAIVIYGIQVADCDQQFVYFDRRNHNTAKANIHHNTPTSSYYGRGLCGSVTPLDTSSITWSPQTSRAMNE